MKLTLDYEKQTIELHEDADIIDLVAQLVVYGINLEGWKIKLSEKIVEVEKWSYYPYYAQPIPYTYGTPIYGTAGIGVCNGTTTNITNMSDILYSTLTNL